MAQLENGYSVSETDDDRTHMNDPDLVSLRSNLTGSNKKSPGVGRSDRYEFYGGHHHKYSGVSEGVEHVVRSQEGQLALY